MKTMNKKGAKRAADFVVQGSILAMAGILVRIIGMLYRMPLNDIIGKQGNGYYTSAYNVYNILLILSSYSMPVAISKMISSRLARGEYENCRRILPGGSFVCHHCGRNCRLCTVVWSRFICRADENAFFQLCLKNPGADDLDHGLSGSFKRLFSGNRHHGAQRRCLRFWNRLSMQW